MKDFIFELLQDALLVIRIVEKYGPKLMLACAKLAHKISRSKWRVILTLTSIFSLVTAVIPLYAAHMSLSLSSATAQMNGIVQLVGAVVMLVSAGVALTRAYDMAE